MQHFLQRLAGGFGLLATSALAVTPIAPGVNLIPGHFEPNSQPDGNTVMFSGSEGLIVFDAGRHPAHTQLIIDYARDGKQPIVAVINSHWHLDHSGGDILLRQAYPGLQVYASTAVDAALKGFLASERTTLLKMIDEAKGDEARQQPLREEVALIDAGDKLRPDRPVTAGGDRKIAGRSVELGLEKNAVTAGDVWLFDPASGVLAAGDLVTLPVPFLDTACPQGWQHSLDALGKLDFKWLVPGHGEPMRRAQFERYRSAYGKLLSCAASTQTKAQCEDGWLRDIGDLVPADQQKFTRALLDYYLDGSLRADPAKTAKLCGA
jgi:glyoxylase-like metal-dependent hydrolase (beta-lactamase superfamily II)